MVCGVAMTIIGSGFILAFNSPFVWKGLAPLVAFIVPILPFFKDMGTLYEWTYIDIHSPALLIYGGIFVISSLAHTLVCWVGYGNKNSTQRGDGYLFLLSQYLFSGHVEVGQFFVHLLEVLLVMAVGAYLWIGKVDIHFGSFLVVITGNELIALLTEKSGQLRTKALIEA